jgi:hypothetical protein
MEMHLVHQNEGGQLAVIGVLFNEGEHNPAMDAIWNNLPPDLNTEHSLSQPVDVSRLLPADQSYYHYTGSLTTPPCTEGVMWYVLSTPLMMSRVQLDAFRTIMSNNARPVQPLHQRSVAQVIPSVISATTWGGIALVGAIVAAGAIWTSAVAPEVVTNSPIVNTTPLKAVVDMVLPALGM